MALFTNNKAIVLLQKDHLLLFTKSSQVLQLSFPPEVVKHQEILDNKLFEKLLTDFFSQTKKQNVVLLLADDIVFQKMLPLTATSEEIQSFYESIPFPQSILAKKMVKTAQKIVLFATNRNLYQTIISIAERQLWEIKEVIPLMIFASYIQGQEVTYQTLSHAIQHKEFIETTNFLKEEKSNTSEKQKITSPSTISIKQYLMLAASLLFLFIALAAAAINIGILPFNLQHPLTTATPTIQPNNHSTIQSTVTKPLSPTPILDKKRITIYIRNGSGVNGQANKVKEKLNSLGYPNTIVDSTPSISSQSTSIVFSNKIPQQFRNEILTKLQSLFMIINSQSSASNSAYDVSIITGTGIR